MARPALTLLSRARDLLQRADPATAGIWPRATALLARQALEDALDDLWRRCAPGVDRCSMRAQLLCLPLLLPADTQLAEDVACTWAGLSRACHHHAYELPPTADELLVWLEVLARLNEKLAAES